MIARLTKKLHPTARQFLKFGTVGAAGFCVDTALVYGFIGLGLGRIAAGLCAFPFTVSFTWMGNRLFTFRDASREKPAAQLKKFALVCAVGFVFNRGTYSLMVKFVPLAYQYPVIGLLAGTAAGMFFNFFMSKKHVFGD